MIVWDILTSIGRAVIGVFVLWKLLRFHAMFNGPERWGMSFAAGAAGLTIPVIWAYPNQSPFSGWAGTIFTWALVLYFYGRVSRLRHERNNHAGREGLPR